MVQRQTQPRAAIVGLGNVLLTDDGVGVHAIRRLMEEAPEGVVLAEVGTALLDTMALFESVDAVVAIDAVKAGGPPGSIYRFDIAEADLPRHISLHEFGIAAAVQSLPAGSRPQVTILGVEPAVIDYGMELSPAVEAVLDEVTRSARAMITKLICTTTGL